MRVLLILIILSTADAVRLEVHPSVLMKGATARLVCRVPPYSENRRVRWGFSEYLVDERQLDGEKSRITWEAFFDHMPCEPGEAFCEVFRNDGRSTRVRQTIQVVGCE